VNPALTGYMAAVLESLDDSARERVAAGLTSLEETVASSAGLRAALTDTSVGRVARRAVLAELLEGKLDAPAARIAAFAAFAASAQDVPVALADAAQHARAIAADGLGEEAPVSVLAARKRVGGYATALFEDLHAEALEGVEGELYAWATALEDNAALRRALMNRDLPAPERAAIARTLLAGRVSSVSVQLASYAIVGGRARDLVGTLQWLVDLVAAERGWRVARVRTAMQIDEQARSELTTTLRSLVGHPVELELAIEPRLIGGVIVEVGDLRVDATTKGRLDSILEQLTQDRHPIRAGGI